MEDVKIIKAMEKFSEIERTSKELYNISEAMVILGMSSADDITTVILEISQQVEDGRKLIQDHIQEEYKNTMNRTGEILKSLIK